MYKQHAKGTYKVYGGQIKPTDLHFLIPCYFTLTLHYRIMLCGVGLLLFAEHVLKVLIYPVLRLGERQYSLRTYFLYKASCNCAGGIESALSFHILNL